MARFSWLLAYVGVAVVTCSQDSKMRSAVYTERAYFKFDLEKVAVIDADIPKPGKGEVLVQVHGSNINPVDHKIVEMVGIAWTYPHKLGSDLAGVVMAVGPGCTRIKVGDEVWGEATTYFEAVHTGGTFATYATVSEAILGLKPSSLSMLEAGAMPMVALTGYESLTWAAGGPKFSKNNVTVLVLGGSGGTGHIGIQLAKAMGATKVITTCSGSHSDFVKSLGADQVIDYHKEKYYDVLAPKSVDVVYDCVGLSGTGDHSAGILKHGGHFVTLLLTALPGISTRIHRPDINTHAPTCVGACSNYDRIDAVGALAQAGKLKVHIDVTYSLEDIKQAFNHSLAGHTTGKVALQMVQNHTGTQII